MCFIFTEIEHLEAYLFKCQEDFGFFHDQSGYIKDAGHYIRQKQFRLLEKIQITLSCGSLFFSKSISFFTTGADSLTKYSQAGISVILFLFSHGCKMFITVPGIPFVSQPIYMLIQPELFYLILRVQMKLILKSIYLLPHIDQSKQACATEKCIGES